MQSINPTCKYSTLTINTRLQLFTIIKLQLLQNIELKINQNVSITKAIID